jgi:uncharacterized coiled-coil DUF342 family protein
MTNTDTNVEALHNQKEQIYQQLQELGKQIGGAIRELKDRRAKRNDLTQLAQEQKTVRKDLSKIIKDKIAQVKVLRAQRGEKPVKAAEQKDSPGKLRQEISKLEHKLETSAMDFSSEQKLTKLLKEKKAALAKIGGSTELDKQIREFSKDIDKLKKESDVAHEKVTEAAKESQKHHEAILELSKKIEDWKKEETTLQEQYTKLKEELNSKADQLPQKKMKQKKSVMSQPTVDEEAMLKEKAAEVEQKVKDKKKLTTEDLLAFQARK